jgi:hypothetical protein
MTLPLKPPIKPQLAKPMDELPEGEGWCYEPKLDGFRTIVFVDGDSHLLQSRNGKPMDRYFPELRFPPGRYVLDGELIIPDGEAEDFEALQNRIHPAASRVQMLAEQTPDRIVATSRGTNQLVIYSKDTVPLAPGSMVEAVGFFGNEGGTPALRLARYRSSNEQTSVDQESIPIDETGPVTQIRQIHSLAQNRPGAVFPVKVRGVITYLDLGLDDFYLQDGSDSITVRNQLSAGLCPFLQQEGMYVELDGDSDGRNPPAVVPRTFVTVLGKGRMPDPDRHSLDYLMSGKDDTRWVEIEGVVREVEEHLELGDRCIAAADASVAVLMSDSCC